MDRRYSCLPEVEETRADAVPAKAQGINAARSHGVTDPQAEPEAEKHYRTIPPTPYQRPPGVSYTELQKQGRRAKQFGVTYPWRSLIRSRGNRSIVFLCFWLCLRVCDPVASCSVDPLCLCRNRIGSCFFHFG